MQSSHALCANAVRVLALSSIEKAESGHPGVVLGFADVLTVLWRQHMRFDLSQPDWDNRDRFVLSNGHASALYYAILHCSGMEVGLDDLRDFRQLGSRTPGHPERDLSCGIDVTTGPLGQGLANAVGMAMVEMYHRIKSGYLDYFTYVAVGDGCLMEGISHEACALAGRLGLGRLIVCWDDNGISIDGHIAQWAECSVVDRFRAYGWQVIDRVDGHDPQAIDAAIVAAQNCLDRPTLIAFKTIIGHGTDLADSAQVHGKPLGMTRLQSYCQAIGWQGDNFSVPESVYMAWRSSYVAGRYVKWLQNCSALDGCSSFQNQDEVFQKPLDPDWSNCWASWLSSHSDLMQTPLASRQSSQWLLRHLVSMVPQMMGGSADLSESTGMSLPGLPAWQAGGEPGRFVHFGVREFAMFAIANGMATCAGTRPFVSTFLVFSDYGLNAIRLASLMQLPVTFIFTHDSVCVGEDGPTHQPIEQLSHLRSIPGLSVWRPCDAFETGVAWKSILESSRGPSCLILSRQSLPSLGSDARRWSAACGAYRLDTCGADCDGVLIATGSEVHLALQVQSLLADRGVTVGVLSVPCAERFAALSHVEQKSLLPVKGFRLVIEAGATPYWYRWVAQQGVVGDVIGIDCFGASAPGAQVYVQMGMVADVVCRKAMRLYNASIAASA